MKVAVLYNLESNFFLLVIAVLRLDTIMYSCITQEYDSLVENETVWTCVWGTVYNNINFSTEEKDDQPEAVPTLQQAVYTGILDIIVYVFRYLKFLIQFEFCLLFRLYQENDTKSTMLVLP